MKRPVQHTTDTVGSTQLREVLESLGWTVEEKRNDYGIDFEVEVFRDGQTTGITFKIQLKSTGHTRYSPDRSYVTQRISRASLLYMCKELRSPVILVHADITTKKTYWTAPQLDKQILAALDAKPHLQGLTFRIPTQNELAGSAEQLLDAVASSETVLSTRSLMATRVYEFVDSIEGRFDKHEVSQDLKNKSDAMRLSHAEDLFQTGSLGEVREKIRGVISDPEASVENRFWGLLTAERVEISDALRRGAAEGTIARIQLTIRHQMQQVTRKGPHHLKFFALIASKAAELYALTSREVALYLNWKINQENGDQFWKSQLAYHRANLTRQVVRKFEQCMRLVGLALSSDSIWVLPHALLHIAEATAPFVGRLRDEGLQEAASSYTASAFRVCQLAASIASVMHDDNALGWAAGHAATLVQDQSTEIHRWAEETVEKIKDREMRDCFIERLRKLSCRNDDQSLSIQEEQRVYEAMAASMGINLADTKDSIARVVRIGIADFDPTRVLKNCQHLFVSLGSIGLPGEWLQLPTAGTKLLHCTLKDKTLGGVSLDSVYASFKAQYCDGCLECSPHPADWSYSHPWQRQQNKRHQKFAARGGGSP